MKTQLFTRSLLFIVLTLFICVQAGSAPQQPPTIGQIVWVKGDVKALGANQAARALQRRSPIFEKDTIVTDKTGTGEVVFTDNSIVSLQEDSQFRIDSYQFGKNVPAGKAKYVASLVKGGFRTITGLIPKENASNYQVNTPVSTIAVQGTKYAAVLSGGKLYMKQYGGTPCIKNKYGTICLSTDFPYASSAADSAPQRLTKMPSVFQTEIQLTPGSFDPTATPSSPGGNFKGGVVNSFCIG
ncbi:MAG: FecR family protein [Gammaproteobacteria bacterium]